MRSSLLVLPLALLSCHAPRADVTVTNAWAQPFNKAGTSAAVYMTVAAGCEGTDELRAVRARPPQRAALYESRVRDNALALTALPSVAIPCGRQTALKPMGRHVVVTGIAKPLGIGDRIPLTLTFDRAGEVAVTAEITTMAVMEDVDPMRMHGGGAKAGGMDHMHMH